MFGLFEKKIKHTEQEKEFLELIEKILAGEIYASSSGIFVLRKFMKIDISVFKEPTRVYFCYENLSLPSRANTTRAIDIDNSTYNRFKAIIESCCSRHVELEKKAMEINQTFHDKLSLSILKSLV